jgi:hypothetical protein
MTIKVKETETTTTEIAVDFEGNGISGLIQYKNGELYLLKVFENNYVPDRKKWSFKDISAIEDLRSLLNAMLYYHMEAKKWISE